MLGIGLYRSSTAVRMPNFVHIDENRLLSFYRLWNTSPELVSDGEFADIQLHLLECDDCAEKARKCEEQTRPMPLLIPREIS